MTLFGLTLSDLATIVGLLAAGGGAAWTLMRLRLGQDFASQRDIEGVTSRLDAVERQLANVPSHDDLRRLEGRVAAIESAIAGTRAEVAQVKAILEVEGRSNRELVSRIDRQITLLLRHELEKEKRGKEAG